MQFIDCETFPFASGLMAPPIVCTSFACDGEAPQLEKGLGPIRRAVDSGETVCGHNVAYDIGCLASDQPDMLRPIFDLYDRDGVEDTMLRQQLIDIAYGIGTKRSYSLADVRRRIDKTVVDKNASPRLEYESVNGLPLDQWPQRFRDYPIEDVRSCQIIHAAQEAYRPWLVDQYRQSRAAFALRLVAAWGLEPDPVKVDKWEADVRGRYDQGVALLKSKGLMRPNGTRNVAAAREYMATVAAAEGFALDVTEAGEISLAKEQCAKSHDTVIQAYGTVNSLTTLLSKDLKILRRESVHTRYDMAESGRSTSRDPNVQNFGRDGGVRECFRAPDGWVFIVCDYSTLELCTLAQVCFTRFGSSKMRDAINDGRDCHLMFAASLLGLSYDETDRRHRDGDARVKEMRQVAKAGNFGLPGGLGSGALRGYVKNYGVVLSAQQADDLRSGWFSQWPEMRLFFDDVRKTTERQNPIVQLFSGRVRGRCGFTDGCNTYFQGLAADLAKDALYRTVREAYTRPESPLYGTKTVNFVHDEIDQVAPEASAHEAAIRLSEVMVEAGRMWCPDVTIKAEPLITRELSKGAKAKWREGRLVA